MFKILRISKIAVFIVVFSAGFLSFQTLAQTKPVKTLNIVVRDANGNLVDDLKAEEVEILDSGVKQEIVGFNTPADSQNGRQTVTLVFGGLGSDGRQYARQAAQDFLSGGLGENVQIAVYVIDRRLFLQGRYTNEGKAVEEAIEMALSGAFERYKERSEQLEADLAQNKGALSELDQITADALEQSSQMQKEDWSYAALDSLNVLSDHLGRVAGRKAIIFFTQGLVISDTMESRFDLLVSAANSAQTAVYTVDCRGLLTSGVADNTRSALQGAGQASSSQFGSTGATSAWQARSLESAGQSVRMNAQETLATLSARTGGSLLANTNDSRPGMVKMADEMNSYYQVAYSLSTAAGDGTLREVAITSTRSDLTISGPTSYYDFPDTGGARIEGFELPLLNALNSELLTNDFGVKSKILRFGNDPEGIHHTLAVELPLSGINFATNEEEKTYITTFSILMLIKDFNGEIVEKISQDYPLKGPLEKLEGMKSGNVLLLRNAHLPPGKYLFEAGARDNSVGAISAVRQEVEVPSWPEGPALSTVSIIDRVDPITDASKEQDNPLRYQDMKIAPNMGKAIVIDPNAQIGFYCVFYPSKNHPQDPVLAMLFFKDGAPLFQGRPPLPAADELGRHQVVLNLPLANFQPGDYEVVVVVQQGDGVAEERTKFQIVAN